MYVWVVARLEMHVRRMPETEKTTQPGAELEADADGDDTQVRTEEMQSPALDVLALGASADGELAIITTTSGGHPDRRDRRADLDGDGGR
jgi:hypothetical protein